VKAITQGSFKGDMEDECLTFRKDSSSFHACRLLKLEDGKSYYLVAVTGMEEKKTDDPESNPEEAGDSEAKVKFYDF
jgi:hypothetical protein